MSHKLKRLLIRTISKLTNKHELKNSVCIVKPTYCSSNVLWSGIRINNSHIIQSYCGLKQCQQYYVTNSAGSENNESKSHNKEILIYYGLLTSKIKTLKVISYTTSIIGLMAQPMLYDKIMTLGAPTIAILYMVMGFSTLVTPLLIQLFTRNYITELKYDPSKEMYTAKTLTFFLQDNVFKFKVDDVRYFASVNLFNTVSIKGKPYMLFDEGILDKEQYIKMMKFDKPIDLQLSEASVKSENGTVKSAV